MKKTFKAFTDPKYEKDKKGFFIFYLVLLLVIILAGWGFFLNWGNIPFDFHDWAEVNAPRLAFLKDAITKGKLPLHMPDSSALRGVTDRYMALPDMILSHLAPNRIGLLGAAETEKTLFSFSFVIHLDQSFIFPERTYAVPLCGRACDLGRNLSADLLCGTGFCAY